jgi:phosphoketolase
LTDIARLSKTSYSTGQCAAGLQAFGYKEEGTTTTLFDMAVLNDIGRCSLALRAAECLPEPWSRTEALRILVPEVRKRHRGYSANMVKTWPKFATGVGRALLEPLDEPAGNWGEKPGCDA